MSAADPRIDPVRRLEGGDRTGPARQLPADAGGGANGGGGPSKRGRVLRVVLPLLVLGLGAAAIAVLIATKPTPDQTDEDDQAPAVVVEAVERVDADVELLAQGEVVPARDARLSPQVAGEVTWIHPELAEGGVVREGEVLLRIDPSDYRLAVEAREGDVAEAELALREAENRQEVAHFEWDRFGPDRPPESLLALQVPQVEAAVARLAAARSQLRRAKLDLRRTRLTAPFDATVVEEQAGLGVTASPQASIARLVGVEHFWVRASVPVSRLDTIDVPKVGGLTEGAAATVRLDTDRGAIERRGRVLRVASQLDARGQMARVVVEVDDPLGLETGGLPLLLGAWVEVAIEARPLREVARLPRYALHPEDTVWVVDDDGRLAIRDVEVVWRDEAHVYVARGLDDGDRLVVSRLRVPVAGMDVRIIDEDEAGPSLLYARRDADEGGTEAR